MLTLSLDLVVALLRILQRQKWSIKSEADCSLVADIFVRTYEFLYRSPKTRKRLIPAAWGVALRTLQAIPRAKHFDEAAARAVIKVLGSVEAYFEIWGAAKRHDQKQRPGIDLVVALAKLARDRMPDCLDGDIYPLSRDFMQELWRIAGDHDLPRVGVEGDRLVTPSPTTEFASPASYTASLLVSKPDDPPRFAAPPPASPVSRTVSLWMTGGDEPPCIVALPLADLAAGAVTATPPLSIHALLDPTACGGDEQRAEGRK